MLETPVITETADQLTACISIIVPRNEIMSAMGPAIHEVFATLAAQGIAPTGPWLTYHRRRPTDTFDLDVSVPIATPVTASGRVKPGKLSATKVARAVYQGNYDGLGGGWGEFCDWIDKNGLKPREDLWECYLVGPETTSDPSAWRTELNRPLADQ